MQKYMTSPAAWLLLLLLIHGSSAFNIFDFFGGHGRPDGSQEAEASHSSGAAHFDRRTGICSGFVCDIRPDGTGTACVAEPRDCPCPEGRRKCMIGDDGHFVCLYPDESCKRLQVQL